MRLSLLHSYLPLFVKYVAMYFEITTVWKLLENPPLKIFQIKFIPLCAKMLEELPS